MVGKAAFGRVLLTRTPSVDRSVQRPEVVAALEGFGLRTFGFYLRCHGEVTRISGSVAALVAL